MFHPGSAVQIAPKASWSANQRQLRWEVATLEAGSKGVFRAAFASEGGSQADAGAYGGGAAAAAFDTTCSAHFYGQAGQTLSGVALESGNTADKTNPSKCEWHGHATAKAIRQ